MLPKTKRASSKDITSLFKGGKHIFSNALFSCRYLSFSIRPSSGTSEKQKSSARFAVIVPTSLVKGAVKRNAVRRRWYAGLEKVLPLRQLADSGIYALILKKEGLDTRGKQIVETLSFLRS